jgi:site-specific DNA recombinase
LGLVAYKGRICTGRYYFGGGFYGKNICRDCFSPSGFAMTTPKGGKKMKCAIYTRVSTDNQAEIEFNSCEAQEAKIRSFIKSQENMEVFKVYSDAGYTGANLNRPALQEMLKDVEIASGASRPRNDGMVVIVYKMDRLTRSPRDFYQLIDLFDKNGVDFISVTERFDTSTSPGRRLTAPRFAMNSA